MLERVVKLLISGIVWGLDSLGILLRKGVGVSTPGRWVVLNYHTVTPEGVAAFALQMRMALRYAVPVPPDVAKLPAGKRCFSVTIDDALAVSAQQALPVLQAYGIPAAVFVPTGFLGRNAGWEMAEGCAEVDQRVMTSAELSHIDAGLVALGSHTVTHSCLSALDQAQLERELAESRRALEVVSGREATMLSFPYCDHDHRGCAALHKAGYTRAFSISPTCVTGERVPLVVGRVRVDPGDWRLEFFLKLHGAYRWQALVSRVKAYFVPRKLNGKVATPPRAVCPGARKRLVVSSDLSLAEGVEQ